MLHRFIQFLVENKKLDKPMEHLPISNRSDFLRITSNIILKNMNDSDHLCGTQIGLKLIDLYDLCTKILYA